jgi:hypothetical protein
MGPFATQSLIPIGDKPRDQQRQKHAVSQKPTDIKIRDLIMPRISLPSVKEGSLLASATAPNVVIPASNVTKNEENFFIMPRRRRPLLVPSRTALPGKYFPIGLNRCDEHCWINALMQFLLFVPSLREIFSFTPQSLYPFNKFIDQYFHDVEEKRSISQADSLEVMRCLLGKFPKLFLEIGVANLLETIRVISRCACAMTSMESAGLRIEWQILWDPNQELSFQKVIEQSVAPPEVLIGLHSLYDPEMRKKPQALFCRTVPRQYFSSVSSVCYEIDAFIEHRAGDVGEPAIYLTYLKINGTWVQCADERIMPLHRSPQLDLPLRRSILFHYRRVFVGQNYGF